MPKSEENKWKCTVAYMVWIFCYNEKEIEYIYTYIIYVYIHVYNTYCCGKS